MSPDSMYSSKARSMATVTLLGVCSLGLRGLEAVEKENGVSGGFGWGVESGVWIVEYESEVAVEIVLSQLMEVVGLFDGVSLMNADN